MEIKGGKGKGKEEREENKNKTGNKTFLNNENKVYRVFKFDVLPQFFAWLDVGLFVKSKLFGRLLFLDLKAKHSPWNFGDVQCYRDYLQVLDCFL